MREKIESQAFVVLRNGRTLFLECTPPPGAGARAFLEKYLADGRAWRMYADMGAVALSFDKLSPEAKRHALLALFPLDYIDESGWWHTVRFSNPGCCESVSALSEWLTGSSAASHQIIAHKRNCGLQEPLKRGDCILFPQPLLLPIMKTFKPPPPLPIKTSPAIPPTPTPKTGTSVNEDEAPTPGVAFPFVNGNTEGLLEYHGEGPDGYAVYKLRPGESLYSAVVVRFTDYGDNESILDACDAIAKRSGICNVTCIQPGQKIVIPFEMLSARFQPEGSEERRAYEAIREEERNLENNHVHTKDLEGIVIILDPGHGGSDQGAAITHLNLFEDEINYDIVCRIKALLEKHTHAQVFVTTCDSRQKYRPTETKRFAHDTCEVLTTTPAYNLDNKCSHNSTRSITLRWNMANDIYYRERKKGVDSRKILFASIHCDYLYNETLRGAMVYVPGAAHRDDRDVSGAPEYRPYKEVSRNSASKSTKDERKRDEALSRRFASNLLVAMRTHTPPLKVHDAGDPIRNIIRRNKTSMFLPGVLRFNNVPTKVLVELANMKNLQDQQRLADPRWRQWFAEAFVTALYNHYNNH